MEFIERGAWYAFDVLDTLTDSIFGATFQTKRCGVHLLNMASANSSDRASGGAHNAGEDSRHSASGGAHPAGETFTLAFADTSLVVAAQHIKDADDALKDAITFLRQMEAFWFDCNVRMGLEAVWFARETLCRAQSCWPKQ